MNLFVSFEIKMHGLVCPEDLGALDGVIEKGRKCVQGLELKLAYF